MTYDLPSTSTILYDLLNEVERPMEYPMNRSNDLQRGQVSRGKVERPLARSSDLWLGRETCS